MSEKGKCVLAYIFGWIGGLIVLFGLKDNERNTKYHAAQAIVASGLYFIVTLVYRYVPFRIPMFSTIVWGLYMAAVIIGIVKAVKEQNPEIPGIGKIAESIFNKKIEDEPQQ